MWNQVRQLNEQEQVTIFLTTHYMEEAESVANRIAIIDHGALVAEGTSGELKERTGTDTLEQAFLALTGATIRDEEASSLDDMRSMAKLWRRER
jgi:ABC-2 type transport system ATP-binding protein